jgi:glycerophosphoryl diester phosphodiesterase
MRYQDGPRPRLFGHRGAAGVAPENTLPSFEAAIAAGVDRLELDVHATADGQIVIFHDATLERTTDGKGPLRARSWGEVKALDAGHQFRAPDGSYPFRGRGVRVPLLAELLAAFPEAPLNIEVKQAEPAIEAEVLAVLDRFGARERTLLAAEDASIMERLRAAAPDMKTGLSAAEVVEFLGNHADPSYRPRGFALQVPPTYGDFAIVTPETIAAAHARGLEVHVWTINDEAEMERLLDLGVDGLITDLPARAAAVLRRRGLRA